SAPPLPATPVPPPPTVIIPPTAVVIPIATAMPTLIAPPTIIVIPTTVVVPTTIILPTVTPMGITVNGSARVNAPDGDMDVRLEPRMDAEVNADLTNGDIVRVLGGPESADNFVWWLVRGPDGEEGWVIEDTNGEGIVPA
ncbi:MAG: SH3 domain-containing protein, partial [Burkholderiales bacterium]|nr:SH3 domain-containing protein [Anaerolineae bacterium]